MGRGGVTPLFPFWANSDSFACDGAQNVLRLCIKATDIWAVDVDYIGKTASHRWPINGSFQLVGLLEEEEMIRHIVLTKFKSDTAEEQIAEIYKGLSELTEKLSGAHNFTGGRSVSPEQIERGYMHGFVIDFDSRADLKIYAEHPEHRALGSQLVENAIGAIDGILVLDLDLRPNGMTL